MHENRLTVKLKYDDQHEDVYQWQVYSPNEITEQVRRCGFDLALACTEFDETREPSADRPRAQFVFQKSWRISCPRCCPLIPSKSLPA